MTTIIAPEPDKALRHMYFQCEDDPINLILVNSSLFTTGGNPSFWFNNVFGGGPFKREDPLGSHTDGIPVYYLPIPRAVMLELLRLMRYPQSIEDATRHVPLSIQKKLSLKSWLCYMEEFGLMPAPGTRSKLSGGELDMLAAEKFAQLEAVSSFQHMKRVAEALVDAIKLNHPEYSNFRDGLKNAIKCSFIYSLHGATNNIAYHLPLPGETASGTVNVAYYLAYNISHRDDRLESAPNRHYFILCIERAIGGSVDVIFRYPMNYKSKASNGREVRNWPFDGTLAIPGQQCISEMTINRTGINPTRQSTALKRFAQDICREKDRERMDDGSSSHGDGDSDSQ